MSAKAQVTLDPTWLELSAPLTLGSSASGQESQKVKLSLGLRDLPINLKRKSQEANRSVSAENQKEMIFRSNL